MTLFKEPPPSKIEQYFGRLALSLAVLAYELLGLLPRRKDGPK